jgi:hypothetical protein
VDGQRLGVPGQEFTFEGGEEALGHGVVVRSPDRTARGPQTLTYRLKQIGRMQYFVITGAGSTSLRVAVFERAEIELVRSLFGRLG